MRAPPSGDCVIDIEPPCALTTSSTIDRPRPLPPSSRERASSRRTKRLQHPLAFGFGDARAVVVDGQHDVVAEIGESDVDPARRVPGGVFAEVAHHPAQRVGIALHPRRGHPRGVHPLRGRRAEPMPFLERQVVEVDRAPATAAHARRLARAAAGPRPGPASDVVRRAPRRQALGRSSGPDGPARPRRAGGWW